MDLFQHVAARIRDFRTAFAAGEGLSQDALAKELGVATNTISRWETGTYKPSLEDLDKLARFFGKSILEFFPNTATPQNEQVAALLRAASDLPTEDVEELRRYAEFRRARSIYGTSSRPSPGRKPKNTTP